ncbi:MAG: hypothetical protein CTY24_00095 [Methylobacter sp.]|nr:MAG: hypothetical protein CTY24_00095 [Methylobacter sp.]
MLKFIFYFVLAFGVKNGFPVDTTLVIFFGILAIEQLYLHVFPAKPKGAVFQYGKTLPGVVE